MSECVINTKELDPFTDLINSLTKTGSEAQTNWNENEHLQPQIFKEWCLLAHNLLASKMVLQVDRVEIFRELAKNFGHGFEPQEAEFDIE